MSNELKAANRYLNLMRNKAKRDYGFNYLSWLREGATGPDPDRHCSVMAAQAVRLQLADILGPEPFKTVRE